MCAQTEQGGAQVTQKGAQAAPGGAQAVPKRAKAALAAEVPGNLFGSQIYTGTEITNRVFKHKI